MPRTNYSRPRQPLRNWSRGWLAVSALLLTAGVCLPARAETWADRLGFPAGSKVVVLHAHELGMCYETNAAGTRLLAAGAIGSASAMAPGPWFADVAAWCRAHPDADVGLELTLNSEWESYRWQPVSPSGLVPTLTDADGFLWRLPTQAMVNATADDVGRELRAQIARARSAGRGVGGAVADHARLATAGLERAIDGRRRRAAGAGGRRRDPQRLARADAAV